MKIVITELPELEVVCEVLQRRAVGQTIAEVKVLPPGGPIVVRDLTQNGFEKSLIGTTVTAVNRRGKFLAFSLHAARASLFLVLNPKLTGRLQLANPDDRCQTKTHVILTFATGRQLRYLDQKQMGQLYLTHALESIPNYAEQGPEPFSLSLEAFRDRLQTYRGEIKGILTRGRCVAGIGNAYADEILWAARLHPYRKRTQLSAEEIERLYSTMQATLLDAIEKARSKMQENIDCKPRDFLAIHMKTGKPCPRCGTPISLVKANQRVTNYCRKCQPGGLIKGM
jgi:formamidopyrimidine-DNA glycosylase